MSPWHDDDLWQRLCAGTACPVCLRGAPEHVICNLPTAFVTAPPTACVAGYCCVVHRRHVVELHELAPDELTAFAADLQRVGAAVKQVTAAHKLNLLSLGNLVPHLHVHVCPRRAGDRFDGRVLDVGDVDAGVYAAGAHATFIAALHAALTAASA